jgi:hypothetical protein
MHESRDSSEEAAVVGRAIKQIPGVAFSPLFVLVGLLLDSGLRVITQYRLQLSAPNATLLILQDDSNPSASHYSFFGELSTGIAYPEGVVPLSCQETSLHYPSHPVKALSSYPKTHGTPLSQVQPVPDSCRYVLRDSNSADTDFCFKFPALSHGC